MTNGGGRHGHKDKKKTATRKKAVATKGKPKEWVEKALAGNGKDKA